MTGVEGRRGAWIDAIAPRCAVWDRTSQTPGIVTTLNFAGGRGGEQAIAYCVNAPLINALYVQRTRSEMPFVDVLQLWCRDASGQVREDAIFNGAGEIGGSDGVLLECPYDYVAVGLHGRAGDFVDAVGLICAPAPANQPALKPPSGIGGIQADRPVLKPIGGIGGIRKAPDTKNVGGVTPTMKSRLPAPPPANPTPPQSPKLEQRRYDLPAIRSDDGIMERIDYCLNFGEECGDPAASAYCAATDPQRPIAVEAPLEFGIGRTFTIGDRQLCEQDNCSSFTYVVCAAP
ncbi:MAG: hypothetical protein R3E84_05300 [Pseudomonadales bacterium]